MRRRYCILPVTLNLSYLSATRITKTAWATNRQPELLGSLHARLSYSYLAHFFLTLQGFEKEIDISVYSGSAEHTRKGRSWISACSL